jgi:hypothetical protein
MKNSKKFRYYITAILTGLVAGAACALLAGCTSFVTASGSNKVVTTVTTKTFGVRVCAATTQNASPEVDLGLQVTTVQFMPLSTNGPINSPNYATTFGLQNNASPFTFDGNDTIAAGNYSTYSMQPSNVVAQPVVPK